MTLQKSPLDRIQIDAIATVENHAQWGALLDQTFKLPPEKHFFEDFPIWSSGQTQLPHLKIGAYQGKLLISSAAARIVQVKIGERSYPVALIGGVATYEEFRGLGLASQLVKYLVEWAGNKGVLASVLWGSEYSLYSKLGFEYAGFQMRIPLKEMKFETAIATQKLNRGFHPLILRLMMQRKGGIALENRDLLWLSKHPNVEWFWLGDDTPIAYAAYGRGIDLPGLVHEFGGDTRDLFSVLAEIYREHPEAQLLASPAELRARNILFDETKAEMMCLARPGPLAQAIPELDLNAIWLWGLDSV